MDGASNVPRRRSTRAKIDAVNALCDAQARVDRAVDVCLAQWLDAEAQRNAVVVRAEKERDAVVRRAMVAFRAEIISARIDLRTTTAQISGVA